MKVKSESEVAQSCLTLSDPMDCSPGSSAHEIFQARVLELGCHCLLCLILKLYLNKSLRDFPGGPVVKTLPSNAGDEGSIPG